MVGMTGTLSGKRYRVAGRVVMGVVDDGVTYYWQEFNVVNDEGKSATLVFEESERGGEWKLFVMFEPTNPMTAAEAAKKRPGDRVNLDGTNLPVTLKDNSRVYYVEGTAPEGVEVGDVAHYFNAESGPTMEVVSWTGEEVEFFRGFTLQSGMVAAAFGIQETFRSTYPKTISNFTLSGTNGEGTNYSGIIQAIVAGIFILIVIVPNLNLAIPRRRGPAVVKTLAADAPFKVGTLIKVKGTSYRISKHLAVEIAQVGLAFRRHEYELAGDDDSKMLLVYGWQPGGKDWVLFTPVDSDTLTPQQAGTLRFGDKFTLNGVTTVISQIFQYTINLEDPINPDTWGSDSGNIFYGLSGESGSMIFMARWNNNIIRFYRGEKLPEKQIETLANPPAAP